MSSLAPTKQPGVFVLITYTCPCCKHDTTPARGLPRRGVPKRTRSWRREHGHRVQLVCPVCGWSGRFSRCAQRPGEKFRLQEWREGSFYGEEA